ncbi:MAG: hypothetical protein FWH06_01735 [Oscillospiraceae bacterium]|nr:hypothetical protein [Oscillospiraceae bacterium]
MAKEREPDGGKINIIHAMADGTLRASIDGYIIPYNETTEAAYRLLAKWAEAKDGKDAAPA